MTLKNRRTPLLTYFKLCASFRSHWWIQTGVTVRKFEIWVKIGATLKFDRWPWKTIGHIFYATSSFVHHFVTISEFKLKLQSGSAQIGSETAFIVPCDLEIWQMTLKNNRAPLLSYFKLSALFRSHLWIQTGVMVRKSPNWGKTCFDLCDLHLWPLTLISYTDITFVDGNISCKFHDDTITGTEWKGCDRRTDGRTGPAWSQLKIDIYEWHGNAGNLVANINWILSQ